jgi:NACalpha-BTF3-like transcription factor
MNSNALSVSAKAVDLNIDPARLILGLSRTGYTPVSALCELIDNAITARTQNIKILIVKRQEHFLDTRKNNVKEYFVIDDGQGMDEEGLRDALMLGSSRRDRKSHSLEKFGLGLKSAAFSQGEELHLISSPGNANFKKYVVSLPEIQKRKQYFASEVELSQEDEELIDRYLPNGQGTIVRVGEVRSINHPSIKKTVEKLKEKIGVIYYYFIKENNLTISIGDEAIEPFDVLFSQEANRNGNLDERSWDGRTVRWIEKPKEIVLDATANVKATIEVTQLPHPPVCEIDGLGTRKEIRERYRIGAGNYGYYVYRNKRLISWAEPFGGIIPQDQDFYAFRGRVLINESADESFNIDVKKSTITLSDEAWNEISDRSDEYKRKSKKAWQRANSLVRQRLGKDPNSTANEIISDFEPPEILPGEPISTETEELERTTRENQISQEMQSKMRKAAAEIKSEEEGEKVSENEIKQEDIEIVIKGDANPSAQKIFRVSAVEDNALWEPYYDTDRGGCVRINKFHRFARLVFEDNSENTDLQVLFELFLLEMSEAEVYLQKSTDLSREDIAKITAEYRRITSEYLAAMCRKLEGKLPPLSDC